MAKSDSAHPSATVKLAGTTCPQCGKAALHAYRPFCSKRCSDLDLGAWLKGSYAIAGSGSAGPSDEDEPV